MTRASTTSAAAGIEGGASGTGVAGILGAGALAALALVCWFGFVAAFFLVRPFSIPSGSMTPTVLIGDYLFVWKFAYGFSRHSLPLSDVVPSRMEGRVWAADPKRGDIVIFKLPKDEKTDYIKRVVGLPGDRIQVIEGVLTINGKPVKRERIADYETTDASGQTAKVRQYVESLPDGATHRIIERDGDHGFWDYTAIYTVPPGHVFTMGGNRDNSTDSRDLASVGYVPLENLVGRAEVIYWSMGDASQEPAGVRWSRIFTMIH